MNFFNLGGDNILFQEPEKNNTDTPSRIPPIELDEDQFHNYLARFLLCYTIFFIVQQLDENISYTIQHTKHKIPNIGSIVVAALQNLWSNVVRSSYHQYI